MKKNKKIKKKQLYKGMAEMKYKFDDVIHWLKYSVICMILAG